MYLIVVVDDRRGMMFNNRRQSRDKTLCDRILSLVEDATLWMNQYTAKLFEGSAVKGRIMIDNDFLSKAEKDDYCFAENILPNEADVEKIIVFKWNRRYPGDFFFNFELSSWKLTKTEDFAGSSHDNITMEVYEK